jgi:hypothetical protein
MVECHERVSSLAEGLTPSEAHEKLQEHQQHSPSLEGRGGRILQICEAAVLAIVTLTAAYSGFAAAKWDTESRLQLAEASTARSQANRAFITAQQLRTYDASTFNAWFTAYTLGDRNKMQIAERRFRPDYLVAFVAWLKTHPATNPNAPPGPAYMPQYHVRQQLQGHLFDKSADDHTSAGEDAGAHEDQYIRVTVVLAGVLFLVGIGSTFTIAGLRWSLLGLGTALLLAALVLIAFLPAPP